MQSLRSIEELPGTYRGFVEGVIRANLDLARNAISQVRRRPRETAAMHIIRRANIKTKVFLTTSQQKVLFLFIRGPATEDVLLQLDVEFSVNAAPGALAEDAAEPVQVRARIPPVFATGVDSREAALLSAALGEKDRKKIVFLRAGESILGAINPDSMMAARVARLDPGATEAVVVFQRVASSGSAPVFQYQPATFIRLLEDVAAWARAGKSTGDLLPAPLPSVSSPFPAQKIVAAAVLGWMESRSACKPERPNRITGMVMPRFEIGGYRGEVVLRLRADGTLAEKLKDDVFRLRLSVAAVDEGPQSWAEVSFDPPDFLVAGKLYDRLTETLRNEAVLRTLANSSRIEKPLRGRFTAWIEDASQSCFVFRAEKDGDVDTEVFVLRGDWDGVSRVVLAVVRVKVRKTGDDDYSVRFIDEPGSMEVAFTNIPGTTDPKSPRAPEYVLMLIHQLRNWVRALRG